MVLRKGATVWLLEETATYFLLKQSVLLGLVSLTALRNGGKSCKPRAEWIYLLCRGVADLSRAINRKAMHGKLSSLIVCHFFY